MANSTADLLYNLTQSTFGKKEVKHCLVCTYRVPIVNKIQKIPVYMDVQIQKLKNENDGMDYFGLINITSSKIFYDDSCENMELYSNKIRLNKLSSKEIDVFLKKIKQDMEKFKFDKLAGKFVIPKGNIINENIGIDIFGDTYSTAEECCVCYEKTYTKTACAHSLCVECWSSVKKKSCPICREHLYAKEYDDESDEEDN